MYQPSRPLLGQPLLRILMTGPFVSLSRDQVNARNVQGGSELIYYGIYYGM